MANTLGNYNPIFYAQEGLRQLENALGMAGRVYRGYEQERRTYGRGQLINIRKPSTFTAQDAPSTAQDLATQTKQMSLDYWKEVKFAVPDNEMAFTGEQIIAEHIRPAAYAIADYIDAALCGLYAKIPWFYALNASPGSVLTDITGPHQILFDNKVPMADPAMMHFMINGTLQAGLLANSGVGQWQGAGQAGVDRQRSGALGQIMGFNIFANQNVKTHTKGTASTGTLALNGAHSAGATTVALDAGSVTGTLVAGDTFVIAGNTQRYSVTATSTASGNAFASVSIFPALVQAYADNAVVTAELSNSTGENLAFHRNAFALVLAPLPDTIPDQTGARVATVTDPVSGLSLRARQWYDGNTSKNYTSLDVLFALDVLDPNMAVRARD